MKTKLLKLLHQYFEFYVCSHLFFAADKKTKETWRAGDVPELLYLIADNCLDYGGVSLHRKLSSLKWRRERQREEKRRLRAYKNLLFNPEVRRIGVAKEDK